MAPSSSSGQNERERAEDNLSKTASDAASGVRSAGEELKATAMQAKEGLRDTARDLRDAATRQVEGRKDELAGRVEGLAETVHRAADEMRDRETWLADVMDRGSDELVHLAKVVRTRSISDLATEVERFARRQPALFAGATFALGFALARFAKASSTHRYDRGYGSTGYGGQSYGAQTYPASSMTGSSYQGGPRGDYRPQDYRPASETSFTTDRGGQTGPSDPNRLPPHGTELGAHVAGPETHDRQGLGGTTPGTTTGTGTGSTSSTGGGHG